MKHYRFLLAALLTLPAATQLTAQETEAEAESNTLYIRYDDRFKANETIDITTVDSIEIATSAMKLYDVNERNGNTTRTYTTLIPLDAADVTFTNPGRWLVHPDTYSGTNYMNDNATSGYNFKHHLESEHFAVFWDARFGDNPAHIQYPGDGNIASAYNVLNVGERCWQKYVELGFVIPGQSTTDKYKIQLYIPYQTEWRADASGTSGTNGEPTGIGHFNPWAANARGGHTIAHEVGHTFQYLTHADWGWNHGFDYGYGDNASGLNGWWESCANWQAYKVFPERQFTDREYFEGYLPLCHLNLMHEAQRYENCFIQDWWCMKHGTDFIGRMWRESIRPEDPVEAYMRLCGLTLSEFADEHMEGIMRMTTWDIDGVRDYARSANRIGAFPTNLHKASGTTNTWEVDAAYCPENFGYNIINMNNTRTAGVEVKAHFKGIAGADGYRKIRTTQAGWRYAFVAYTTDQQTVYGDIFSDPEGTATFVLPEKCSRVFFVVMGAPKTYWHHPWDDDTSNDEQWPYQVTFENINIAGQTNK